MLYQSSFLPLFCFRNFPVYYFTVFSLPTFVKRQFATSQQQEKSVSLCTEQGSAFYTNLSLCTLVPEGIPEQDCGTGLSSESSVCTSCSSQLGCCHWAGKVVLTNQSHINLCWLLPAKWPPGTPPHLGIGKNSAPNCPSSLFQSSWHWYASYNCATASQLLYVWIPVDPLDRNVQENIAN